MGAVQDYLIAGNGVFVRAERPEFSAIVPWQMFKQSLCGLDAVKPAFSLNLPTVPSHLVKKMIERAKQPQPFVETLFYFVWDSEWKLIVPPQTGSRGGVRLLDPYSEVHQKALIEVHSHPPGANQFSSRDDQSAKGFRVFGLITHLDTVPKLTVRVGIEGHFWEFPSEWVFGTKEA